MPCIVYFKFLLLVLHNKYPWINLILERCVVVMSNFFACCPEAHSCEPCAAQCQELKSAFQYLTRSDVLNIFFSDFVDLQSLLLEKKIAGAKFFSVDHL